MDTKTKVENEEITIDLYEILLLFRHVPYHSQSLRETRNSALKASNSRVSGAGMIRNMRNNNAGSSIASNETGLRLGLCVKENRPR